MPRVVGFLCFDPRARRKHKSESGKSPGQRFGKKNGHFPAMSRKRPGNLAGKFPGHFLDISWEFPEQFLDSSRKCPGTVPENSRQCPFFDPETIEIRHVTCWSFLGCLHTAKPIPGTPWRSKINVGERLNTSRTRTVEEKYLSFSLSLLSFS